MILVPSTEPLFPRSIGSRALALQVEDARLDHAELAAACLAHLASLRARGLMPGDRLLVWTQPAIETLVALVAHLVGGYVSVPIEPKLGERELEHVVRDAAPRAAVAADIAIGERTPGLLTVSATLESGEAASLAAIEQPPVAHALVLYTSGTTGAPKGALITPQNIAANLDMLARAWAWTADDVVVHALPLFHVHGLVLGLFGSLRTGGALHWVPRFAPDAMADALTAHDRTMLFAVPTMYHRLADAADDPRIASALRGARLLVSGSAPLASREHERIERLTGQKIVERYGLTETLIDCSARHDGERKPGRVGPALDRVELRLVDDARVPIDSSDDATIGEIAVRGPHVFAGYLNREDATRAVLDDDGWFYTGDLATRDASGSIRIVGRRATDLIKCGGYKIGAGEVESALLEHPAVREAAVIGLPDPDLGERIVAFVVTSGELDTRALEDHVARLLTPHKRPRQVHVVESLPRNAMGKVQKNLLRASLENG